MIRRKAEEGGKDSEREGFTFSFLVYCDSFKRNQIRVPQGKYDRQTAAFE